MDTTPFDALDPETIDDLLSAEIDGELDAALVDIAPALDGPPLDATVFRAWVEATPAVDARARVLRDAADRLRRDASSPTLDEMSRHRLVNAAITEVHGDEVAETRHRHPSNARARRAYLGIGTVAAGALLVAGVAASINSGETANQVADKRASTAGNVAEVSPGRDASATAGPQAASEPKSLALPDIGAISNIADVSRVAADTNDTSATTMASPTGAARATAYTASSRCLTTLPDAARSTDVGNVAVATLKGTPVVVARGTSAAGQTVTWVYRPTDCVVLLTDAP